MTINIHPGEILLEEFIKPMQITAYRLAKDIDVPQSRIDQIVKRKRSITADTALRLDKYFGLSEGFFLRLQAEYDLRKAKKHIGADLSKIAPLEHPAHINI